MKRYAEGEFFVKKHILPPQYFHYIPYFSVEYFSFYPISFTIFFDVFIVILFSQYVLPQTYLSSRNSYYFTAAFIIICFNILFSIGFHFRLRRVDCQFLLKKELTTITFLFHYSVIPSNNTLYYGLFNQSLHQRIFTHPYFFRVFSLQNTCRP